jgi:hypothetical protein
MEGTEIKGLGLRGMFKYDAGLRMATKCYRGRLNLHDDEDDFGRSFILSSLDLHGKKLRLFRLLSQNRRGSSKHSMLNFPFVVMGKC